MFHSFTASLRTWIAERSLWPSTWNGKLLAKPWSFLSMLWQYLHAVDVIFLIRSVISVHFWFSDRSYLPPSDIWNSLMWFNLSNVSLWKHQCLYIKYFWNFTFKFFFGKYNNGCPFYHGCSSYRDLLCYKTIKNLA